MKFRADLVKQLKPEDFMEEVLANNHCYEPEPNFACTGVGSLRSATAEEKEQEEARIAALMERLEERARKSGPAADTP